MRVSVMRIRFNPRTHVGCDTSIDVAIGDIDSFQSTHPRRVRRVNTIIKSILTSFNPRTHVGCDQR